jgi:hypothetical protein
LSSLKFGRMSAPRRFSTKPVVILTHAGFTTVERYDAVAPSTD